MREMTLSEYSEKILKKSEVDLLPYGYYDPRVIIRIPKGDINFAQNTTSYLEAKKLGLKKIDLTKIRNEKKDKETQYLNELKKIAKDNKNYEFMLNVFGDKFKKLTGTNFMFQKKRVITFLDSKNKESTKMINSDGKRLISIFKQILDVSSDNKIISTIICDMMDTWSAWDKSNKYNLAIIFPQ